MKPLGSARRKAVSTAHEAMIKTELLPGEPTLPLVIRAAVDGLSLETWSKENKTLIESKLYQHGAVLFRDFKQCSVEEFERVIADFSGELLDYVYRSTPRSHVQGHIHTSTEYPADQTIPAHNEMSYTLSWPMKLWLACFEAPLEGGETPVSDSRRIYNRLDPKIRDRFLDKKVMYVRNYGSGIDLTWQDVFQTENREDVERYCRDNGLTFEWISEDHLRTKQVCQAAARHPVTRELVWFNQAHLFHVSNLDLETRDALLENVGEENLSRHSYYGDGSPIEDSVLEEIRALYQEEKIKFRWQVGDVLLVDNLLSTHGREPFTGNRRVYVGMAELGNDPGI